MPEIAPDAPISGTGLSASAADWAIPASAPQSR